MSFLRALPRLCLWLATASAHMQLFYPAPLNASNNPHRTSATADSYLEYPYNCCGPEDRWMYPCRGYEKLLGTADGAATATWQAGSKANFTLWGPSELGGNHYGGSCQVGFSTDKAATFHVATSYEGDCPHRSSGVGPGGQSFDFTVPHDLEPGVQLFAWMWYNREQELNMNCAAVEIVAPGPTSYSDGIPGQYSSPAAPFPPSTKPRILAFADRPLMFVADNGNGCETPHTISELKYPDPGPDIVTGDNVYPLALPNGACGQVQMLAKQAYTSSRGHSRSYRR